MAFATALSTYTEFRRILTVNKVLFDLVIDVFISKLYQTKGLRRRSLSKRMTAGIVRRLFRREKSAVSFPVQFRRTLERLGPTYVKLGQILSIREDILPERITKELTKLQSQALPIEVSAVKRVIESEFNLPLDMIYKDFDENPLAAASLAQVHVAYLHGGEKVVVKVQRPNIIGTITDDINIMRRLASILERIPYLKEYRPAHFVEEFASYTTRELDFTQEGKHADIFRKNFEDEPDIIFPEIYWKYTSKKVLTMEYIDGVRPDNKEKLEAMGVDTKAMAAKGAKAVIKMLYVDGFFHGDPHPGNLMIVDQDKLCLIDLGMIGSFSKEVKKNMFLNFYYMVMGEFETATKYLASISTFGPKADLKGFQKELAGVIKQWSGSRFKEFSLGQLTLQTMNIGAKHQLYFHGDLVLSSKAVLTIEAVGNILDPDLDLTSVGRPIVEEIFIEQFSPSRLTKSVMKALPDYMDFLEQLPQNLLNSFAIVSSGKFQMEVSEATRSKTSKTMANFFPTLSGASIIGASILAISDNTPGPIVESFLGLTGMPVLSLGLFGLSALFLIASYLSDRRS